MYIQLCRTSMGRLVASRFHSILGGVSLGAPTERRVGLHQEQSEGRRGRGVRNLYTKQRLLNYIGIPRETAEQYRRRKKLTGLGEYPEAVELRQETVLQSPAETWRKEWF